MKNKLTTITPTLGKITVTALVLAALCLGSVSSSRGQTSGATISPDLQEVMTLSRQHMSDDVITSYIKSTGKVYHLSADDIVYLNSQGVSQGVITTLLQSSVTATAAVAQPVDQTPPQAPQPPAAPAPSPDIVTTPPAPLPGSVPVPDGSAPPVADATPPGSPEANFNYFHDELAPFGSWVSVAGYGWCWRPDAAINANPDWRPYYDMGQWTYTDNGWFWQSDYSWGDIPFHYGNWIANPVYGWVWVPGYTWGPSWVFWREADADGCIGWAPLPPGAVFVDGGWRYRGVHYGVDFDFGLGASFFVFVGYDHFHDSFLRMRGHEYRWNVPRASVHAFYARSVLHNDFRRDDHGRLINDGIGRERIERFTGRPVVVNHFEERNPVGDREKLTTQRTADFHQQSANEPGNPGGQHYAPAANKVYRPPASSGQYNSSSHQGQGQNQSGRNH